MRPQVFNLENGPRRSGTEFRGNLCNRLALLQRRLPWGLCVFEADRIQRQTSEHAALGSEKTAREGLIGVLWRGAGGSTCHWISLSRGERSQPVERGSEPNDLADHDDCRRLDFGACGGDLP